MLDSGLAFNWSDLFSNACFLDQEKDYKQAEGLVPEMFGTAETKDGKLIVLYGVELEGFCKAFNRPDLMHLRGKFVTSRDEMAKEIGKHTLAEVEKKYAEFDLA